jgi:hypothetical protein
MESRCFDNASIGRDSVIVSSVLAFRPTSWRCSDRQDSASTSCLTWVVKALTGIFQRPAPLPHLRVATCSGRSGSRRRSLLAVCARATAAVVSSGANARLLRSSRHCHSLNRILPGSTILSDSISFDQRHRPVTAPEQLLNGRRAAAPVGRRRGHGRPPGRPGRADLRGAASR